MIVLITGASSGIGEEFAKKLAKRGFNLILTARRLDRLEDIKQQIKAAYNAKVKILPYDLSKKDDCIALYNDVKGLNIDMLINNAGFGLFGKFTETDLDSELQMIDVNIKAVHILTKLFLKDFCKRNHGYILNVSSIAGYMAGPLMSTYYASKNYVLQLTRAISEELKHAKLDGVYIGALCPGPVTTEFNKVAGAEFAVSGSSASEIAEYAVKEMFKRKVVILPKSYVKALSVVSKIAPSNLVLKSTYYAQKARRGDPSDNADDNS